MFIVWGSTYLAIRIGVQEMPPAIFAGLRFVISGIALLVYGKINGKPIPTGISDLKGLAIVGLFLLVGGNGLVVWSEQWVPSGLAALIIATVPLFMSTIDVAVPGGHRLPPVGWVGILIGFGGVVILVSPSLGLAEGEALRIEGIAGLVLASFLWSVGSVYSQRHHVEGDIFVNAGIQMLAGGLVLVLIAIGAGELARVELTSTGILALLYLIVFGSVIGFTSYAYLLRHVPAAKASTYAYVNPVVAVFLGAVILAEPVDTRTILAALVILGGVGIVQVSKMKSSSKQM